MSKQWYCRVADQEIGPLSSGQLQALAREGRLTHDDPVRSADDGNWVPAGRVKGLFALPAPPPPPGEAVIRIAARQSGPSEQSRRPGQPGSPGQRDGVIRRAAPLDADSQITPPPAPLAATQGLPQSTNATTDASATLSLARAASVPAAPEPPAPPEFDHPAPPVPPPSPETFDFSEEEPWNAPASPGAANAPAAAELDFLDQPYAMAPATAATAEVLEGGSVSVKRQQRTLIGILLGLLGLLGALVLVFGLYRLTTDTRKTAAGDDSEEAAGRPVKTAPDEPKPLDATRDVWKCGDVQVKILSAQIQKVQTVHSATGRKGVTELEFLVLRVELANKSAEHKIEYSGWNFMKPQMEDNYHNDYFLQPFSTGYTVEGQVRKTSLYPEKTLVDLLVFQPPAKRASSLVVKLPAEALGQRGVGRFEFSTSWIQRVATPAEAVKTDNGPGKKDDLYHGAPLPVKPKLPAEGKPAPDAKSSSDAKTPPAGSSLSPPPGSIRPIGEPVDPGPLTNDPSKDLGIPMGDPGKSGNGKPPAAGKDAGAKDAAGKPTGGTKAPAAPPVGNAPGPSPFDDDAAPFKK